MKPSITPQEASWHEQVAGLRAAEAARAHGSNPATTAALATATAGPVTIAGLALAPASQGTLWTLQRIAREFTAHADASARYPAATDPTAPGTRELIELGLATLVFIDARGTWKLLDAAALTTLIARAEDLVWTLPLSHQIALQAHFRAEMDRIHDLAGPGEEEEPTPPGKP